MESTRKQRWKPQFSLRMMLALCIVFGLLFAYVGSYYRISRRGMREAVELEMEGFYYARLEHMLATHDMTQHERLSTIFAPANWLDQLIFGAPSPGSDLFCKLE